MSRIQDDILDNFYACLDDNEAVAPAIVRRLKALLEGEKLPKAETLNALYEAESGEKLA